MRKWMWRLGILTAMSLGCLTTAAQAHTGPALKAKAPKQYIVQSGDTLWSIGAKYLDKPWQWRELWKINPHLGDPDHLHAGDVLNLEMHNGKTQLRVTRDSIVKLSPKMRVSQLEDQIPAVAFHLIEPFLSHDLVVAPNGLKKAPYVVGTEQERLLAGKDDFLYVFGLSPHETQVGDRYDIFRDGEILMDPDTRQVKGMLAKYIGQGKVLEPGGITTLRLEDAKEAAHQGDRLLPAYSRMPLPIFNMQAADLEVHGQIIAVLDGVTQVGENQVVVINRGVKQGLKPGDVLGIYQAGDLVPDSVQKKPKVVKLPDELAGEMLIFRLFDELAFGLVLNANQALHVYDFVANLP